jgi:hypothetical protein
MIEIEIYAVSILTEYSVVDLESGLGAKRGSMEEEET